MNDRIYAIIPVKKIGLYLGGILAVAQKHNPAKVIENALTLLPRPGPISDNKVYLLNVSRLSLDKKFIIWDQEWDSLILDKMKKDSEVKLFDHAGALEEMAKRDWVDYARVLDFK